MSRIAFLPTMLALLIAGCGGTDKAPAGSAPGDAAESDALAAPIMTDLDLGALDEGYGAIAVGGPVNSSLPPIDRRQEAIDAARDAAARLVGGEIPPLPDASGEDLAPLRAAVTAAQMATATRIAPADCTGGVRYTAGWVTALPPALQVYPRGAVAEAAGNDAAGCALRVIHFRTPVAVSDVTAFYHARLRAAGWPARHSADGDEHLLRGRGGGTAYGIYVRKAPDGLTVADIVMGG